MVRLSVLDQSTVVTGRSPDTRSGRVSGLPSIVSIGYDGTGVPNTTTRKSGRYRAGNPDRSHRRSTNRIRAVPPGDAAALFRAEGGRAVPSAGPIAQAVSIWARASAGSDGRTPMR